MRKFHLKDVTIEHPDGPQHSWKNPDHDASGQRRDNFGDVVKVTHADGAEVLVPAREFGPDSFARCITDLIAQLAGRAVSERKRGESRD